MTCVYCFVVSKLQHLIPFCVLEFRLALIQILTDRFREKNLQKIPKMVRQAAQNGAKIVVLPVRMLSTCTTFVKPHVKTMYTKGCKMTSFFSQNHGLLVRID